MVFKAHTDPSIIPHWWGRRRLTTMVDKMDVRPGGVWRFVQRGPGHVVLQTVTFKEYDGKTTLTSTSLFETVEDRDGMLKSGMEEGAAETLDPLAEYLAKP